MTPDPTLFAALYGELVPHPWREGPAASAASDAYSLFVARSSALGWLAPVAGGAAAGAWGMNDAGQDDAGRRSSGAGQEMTRVAWFQAGLTRSADDARPVPLQPFLVCAGDVAARLGELRLAAARLLLPVPAGTQRRSASAELLRDAAWFADPDPRSRTAVRVTLDGGRDPAVGTAGPGIVSWLQGLKQDVFDGGEPPPAGAHEDTPTPAPDITDALWNGPPMGHRIDLHGTLAEWSPAALGWLAALLAEAASHHGIPGPLLLTVVPAG